MAMMKRAYYTVYRNDFEMIAKEELESSLEEAMEDSQLLYAPRVTMIW